MLLSNGLLQDMQIAAENQFVTKLLAQHASSFPQLEQNVPAQTLGVVTATVAAAYSHGFFKQQEIATCSTCVLPFLAGGANPAAIIGESGPALQTLVAHSQSILAKLTPTDCEPIGGLDPLARLKAMSIAHASSAGIPPLNIDRSGTVVPYTEQSPVKAGDLVAPAASALPQKAATGSISQPQFAAAMAAVQNNFPDTLLGSVIQNCKKLVDLEFRRVYWDGTPIANLPYTVTLSDGSTRSGTTDGNGLGSHTSVPPGFANVVYGENKNPAKSSVSMDVDPDFQALFNAAGA